MELPYLQRGNIVYLLYVQVCNNNYKERFNTNRILFIAFCWFIYTVNLNIMSNWSLIIVNLTRNLSFTYQNNYLRKIESQFTVKKVVLKEILIRGFGTQ